MWKREVANQKNWANFKVSFQQTNQDMQQSSITENQGRLQSLIINFFGSSTNDNNQTTGSGTNEDNSNDIEEELNNNISMIADGALLIA